MTVIWCFDIRTDLQELSFRYKGRNMNKTKIAIVHDCLHVGGTEKALLTMLKFFNYQKYEVTLWLMNDQGALQFELDKRVIVRCFSNEGYSRKRLMKEYLNSGKTVELIRSMCMRIRSRKAISRHYDNLKYSIFSLPLITDEVYDCVIVYQGLYMHLLATALGRFKAKKRALWIHMRLNHSEEQVKSFRPVYQLFDKIYCVSNGLKARFIEVYGMQEKTEVLHNCFDIEDIWKKANETVDWNYGHKSVLVTVGRISKEKGQLMIPKIARRLKEKGYDFVWLIIGEGDKEELTKLINKMQLNETVLMLGNQLNPYPYIKGCTIYVQPSFSEGFCTSTMEAKILGKPVVTTNVAGMDEQFIDGFDGIVVDKIDPEGMFEKLWEVCDSRELQKSMSENAAQRLVDGRGELVKLDCFLEGRGK